VGTLLQVEDLSVIYRSGAGQVRACDGISLTVGRGGTLGVIGESGSGKTSLALALLGLICAPHTVSGRVRLQNTDLLALSETGRKRLRWRTAALVFQNSLEVLNPVLTVSEQVGEPLRTHLGLTGGRLRQELERVFGLVGLDLAWADAYPHQLSGGMRQRVLLAMALSCRPELLIVDEPTTSLDAASRRDILTMLKTLKRELGFALITISHDLAAVSSLSERLMVLYCGRAVETGETREIMEEPRHPYTRGLLNSSPELFPYKDLWGIPGEPASVPSRDSCAFLPRCTQAIAACGQVDPPMVECRPGRTVRCHRGGIVTLLAARGLAKDYTVGRRRIRALKGASLSVESGETVALVGASGSGKSTLAQVLAGFLRPDRGAVWFKGRRVDGNWASRREGGMQLVLQDPFTSISHRLTVEAAVTEPLVINAILSGARQRRVRMTQVLQAVQLPTDADFSARPCHTLSGGQRQRLAIARALVMQPDLLLADEITSMLDVSTQANLMRLLKGLQNSRGFAMLFVTHDLDVARKVADRIIVLHEGTVIDQGTARRVTEDAADPRVHDLMCAGLSGD